MGIDFHSEKNQRSYTTRNADQSWIEAINNLVPIENISSALDIGCGGGIYSKALSDMGVTSVTGVDFSQAILEGARENCKEYRNISFQFGNAFDTGLASSNFQLLLERALIHHIKDLEACFKEAYRVLKNDGFYIVQDRTPEDCLLAGNENHIRGHFFELFPRLVEKETNCRYHSQLVIETLKAVGFRDIEEVKLWEVRKVYVTKEQLLSDLKERTGRSILHELADKELQELIDHIDASLATTDTIVEKDRWTIWKAVK
ncbi:class I SAM-dependent methyltransferase [Bacillus sp. SD088]|uniref:class I SAM-dependent methyltransferase n=1 Tax=Bacillus sp. SD088 TaxID=2782012 RepID=UPI001A97468A|nr:class I SAM-dependent methyltransferase [Bacillus sp. SD088]MBO0992802.1 methyltransferase domain-containing protein [Bacillus sp. SD088]